MRAHFATDIPASPDTDESGLQPGNSEALKVQSNISKSNGGEGEAEDEADSQEKLQSRIMEFKSDSSKMAVVGEFIDEVLEKAEEEANKQQQSENKQSQQVFIHTNICIVIGLRTPPPSSKHSNFFCPFIIFFLLRTTLITSPHQFVFLPSKNNNNICLYIFKFQNKNKTNQKQSK